MGKNQKSSNIFSALMFGNSVEQFNILTRIYILTMNILITNKMMNYMNFFYDNTIDFSYNVLISWVLSPEFILALMFFFIISFILIIFCFIALTIISYFLPFLMKASLKWLFMIISRMSKVITLDESKINLRTLLNMVRVIDIDETTQEIHKGKHYDKVYNALIEGFCSDENNTVRNVTIIMAVFLSTLIVYDMYDIGSLVNSSVHNTLKWILIVVNSYWILNSSFVHLIDRKAKKIKELLTSIT